MESRVSGGCVGGVCAAGIDFYVGVDVRGNSGVLCGYEELSSKSCNSSIHRHVGRHWSKAIGARSGTLSLRRKIGSFSLTNGDHVTSLVGSAKLIAA